MKQVCGAERGRGVRSETVEEERFLGPVAQPDIERLIIQRRIRHGNHPVLTVNVAAAIVMRGNASGCKLDKPDRGQIDGLVDLTTAFNIALAQPLFAPNATASEPKANAIERDRKRSVASVAIGLTADRQ
jgi:hypothetical protein